MDVGITPAGKPNNLFHFLLRIYVVQFPCIEYYYFTKGNTGYTLQTDFCYLMYAGNCGIQRVQTKSFPVPTDASGKELGQRVKFMHRKFKVQNTQLSIGDVPLMRASEMYLIEAEATRIWVTVLLLQQLCMN